jgi:voltage-gated potassium channel
VSTVRRIQFALLAMLAVVAAGSIGYVVLGFSPLDAIYQTVTTITTVGFREVHPLGTGGKIFTIVLIIAGVGTALYAFSVVLESLVEGHLRQHLERRKMERDIAKMSGHTIVCGWAGWAARWPATWPGRALRWWWWTSTRGGWPRSSMPR